MDEKNGLLPGFGKRLKDRRNELKMTQRVLAEKSGIAFRSIQDYESEKRTPKIDVRIAIAKALAVPYECLFVPSALSTNLAEVGTDCISRQAAIDMITNHWSDFSNADNYRTAKACVDAVPPIRPKRGKWTADNACSECGCQPWFSRDIHNYNFCPNCGADMRER